MGPGEGNGSLRADFTVGAGEGADSGTREKVDSDGEPPGSSGHDRIDEVFSLVAAGMVIRAERGRIGTEAGWRFCGMRKRGRVHRSVTILGPGGGGR